MKATKAIAAAIALTATAVPAQASTLLDVQSYDMPNGGQGSYFYWDQAYDGSGNTSVTGAPLSGGTGDLTDGVVAPGPWFNTENGSGTGPYVGWFPSQPGGLNPLISFDFGTDVLVTTFRIHVDNVISGGVRAPSIIRLSNLSQATTFLTSNIIPQGSQGWIELDGLSFSGSNLDVQLFQDGSNFIMASEVQFLGSTQSAVPEPSTWAMLILGFFGVGGLMRSQRRKQKTNVSYA